MLITVFTPTYNRAPLLKVLYESLCNQDFKDFEWLIVDDGSKDNTKEVVDGFIREQQIAISYYKKENGGKHRAVNYGVQRAKGELFFIVDSDDKLPSNSLSSVNEQYLFVRDDDTFAGVCGLKSYYNGDFLPGNTDYDVLECRGMDYCYKRPNNSSGDIAEIIVRTSIMKQYPFPEFDGEMFCAESAIWNPIFDRYNFRFFSKVIYLCEFLEDGLSANSLRSRMNSPLSAMYIYSGLSKCNIPFRIKIKAAINYWRFYYCRKSNNHPRISYFYYPLCMIGYVIHRRDIVKSQTRLRIGRER